MRAEGKVLSANDWFGAKKNAESPSDVDCRAVFS